MSFFIEKLISRCPRAFTAIRNLFSCVLKRPLDKTNTYYKYYGTNIKLKNYRHHVNNILLWIVNLRAIVSLKLLSSLLYSYQSCIRVLSYSCSNWINCMCVCSKQIDKVVFHFKHYCSTVFQAIRCQLQTCRLITPQFVSHCGCQCNIWANVVPT